jgi:hypothetical protein
MDSPRAAVLFHDLSGISAGYEGDRPRRWWLRSRNHRHQPITDAPERRRKTCRLRPQGEFRPTGSMRVAFVGSVGGAG